jgi:hypothetical protein
LLENVERIILNYFSRIYFSLVPELKWGKTLWWFLLLKKKNLLCFCFRSSECFVDDSTTIYARYLPEITEHPKKDEKTEGGSKTSKYATSKSKLQKDIKVKVYSRS